MSMRWVSLLLIGFSTIIALPTLASRNDEDTGDKRSAQTKSRTPKGEAPQVNKPATGIAPAEPILQSFGVKTDTNSLLNFLKMRSVDDRSEKRIANLVQRLGDDAFSEREAAQAALVHFEEAAVPPLRTALKHRDPEIRRRAAQAIAEIDRQGLVDLSGLVAFEILRRKPNGYVQALMRYLPHAKESMTEEAICFGLDAGAKKNNDVVAVLTRFLRDPQPPRRAIAACIVASRGTQGQKRMARECFKDANALVRLRSAQGFLAEGDKAVVPVLIELLATPEITTAWQAEELLVWTAEDDGPEEVLEVGEVAATKRAQRAWQVWWKTAESNLMIAKRIMSGRRPTLLFSQADSTGSEGFMYQISGSDGGTRWRLNTKANKAFFRFLSSDRVFIGEEKVDGRNLTRLSVRTLRGKVLWAHEWAGSVLANCWQLRNDSFLVVDKDSVLILDSKGAIANRISVRIEDTLLLKYQAFLRTAERLPGGKVLCVPYRFGLMQQVDILSQEVTQVTYGLAHAKDHERRSILPSTDGNLLVVDEPASEIREHRAPNKITWRVRIPGVKTAIAWWPNGNALVGGSRLLELHNGRVVGECFLPVNPFPARVLASCFLLLRLGFDNPAGGWPEQAAVSQLINGLRHQKSRIRRRSAWLLEGRLPKNDKALSQVLEALADEPAVADPAREALVSEGSTGLSAAMRLGLRHKNLQVKRAVMDVIAAIIRQRSTMDSPSTLNTTVLALTDCLRDADPVVRAGAAGNLALLGSHAKHALPKLMKALQDTSSPSRCRISIVHSIGAFGRSAASLLPELLELAKDKDEDLSAAVISQLGKIGAPDRKLVSILRTWLRHASTPKVRSAAVVSIGDLQEGAFELVADLVEILKLSRNEDLRVAAAMAIKSIGREARSAAPALSQIVKNKTESVRIRSKAIEALSASSPSSAAIVALLKETQTDSNYLIRDAAKRALHSLEEYERKKR